MSQAKAVSLVTTTTRQIAATKIIEVGANFVTFERKKPHTSSLQEETIVVGGARSVLAVYGNVGETGSVVVKETAQVYADKGVVEITADYVEVKNEFPTRFFFQDGVALNLESDAFKVEGEGAAE
ncbi:hypothetical protein [Yersinia ruckeri]|uniref:hypothetical protein n=1 Tax=Yersinia ruckeri TaxID=29486 RepID=UPI0022373BA6|nr:hypothetical protein [Yersinia ruckeri]MCW6598748.1 hypothetical protein [Yersinia ruckeri]